MRHQTLTLRLAALLVLLACMWSPADAGGLCDGDRRLLGGGWSFHAMDRSDKNETHNVVGLQCNGWSAFAFENSQGDDALAIGREWMPYRWRQLEGGFYAAAWFGYFPDSPAAFIPVGALRGRWNITEHVSATVSTLAVVSTLHVEFRF